jgi:hypothetical protein
MLNRQGECDKGKTTIDFRVIFIFKDLKFNLIDNNLQSTDILRLLYSMFYVIANIKLNNYETGI